jgi:hypothetical protein
MRLFFSPLPKARLVMNFSPRRYRNPHRAVHAPNGFATISGGAASLNNSTDSTASR